MNRQQRRKAAKNKKRNSPGMTPGIFASGSNVRPDPINLALSLHQRGQLAEAGKLYEHILQQDSKNTKVLNSFGVLKQQIGDTEAAIGLISEAVRIEPNNIGFLNNLGNAYRAGSGLDEAIDCYQRALKLDSSSAASYLNLGISFVEKAMPAEAGNAFQRAIALSPNYFQAYLALGDLLQLQGKLAEAIAAYRQALSIQPKFFEAWLSLGMALYRQGDLMASQEAYQRSLEINPYSTEGLSNMAATLYEQGRIDAAIACYRAVIDLEPASADGHINLGVMLSQKGEEQEAIASFERAIACEPQSVKAIKALASLAEIKSQQYKWLDAINIYRRILDIDPNSVDALVSLGIALRQTEDVEEAIAHLERARQIEPANVKAYAHLGLALQDRPLASPEAAAIFDYPGLVAKFPLTEVEGWESVSAYNSDLKDYIYNHPTLVPDRFGKPLYNGRQTYEIFEDAAPVMDVLRRIIQGKLEEYIRTRAQNSNIPYFQNRPAAWKLSGWAVVLEPQGFQGAHIHPESFCSGVYYISIPDSVAANESQGNLKFVELFPRAGDEPTEVEKYIVKPQEGLLVVFPSYFWHGTVPFEGGGDSPTETLCATRRLRQRDRICISFNTIPA